MGSSVLVGLLSAVTLLAATAASASAESTTCAGNSGSIKLSPGLSETPTVQNISIKGTLSGCTGSTVTGGKYVAHLKTTHPVTCAALSSAGEPTTGTIVIKWSPKGQGNSNGTFSMPLTETTVPISGTIEKGMFEKDSISGTVTQKYAGKCGGKKKVNKGTFTGSEVVIS